MYSRTFSWASRTTASPIEAVLTDRAPDGAGEDARLQRRDAGRAVELGAPRLLVGLDQQVQAAVRQLVPGRRLLA